MREALAQRESADTTVLGLTFRADPRAGVVHVADAHGFTVFARTPRELERALQEVATREVGRDSRHAQEALRESAATFAQALMNARNVDDWQAECEVHGIVERVRAEIEDFLVFRKLRGVESERTDNEGDDPSFVP